MNEVEKKETKYELHWNLHSELTGHTFELHHEMEGDYLADLTEEELEAVAAQACANHIQSTMSFEVVSFKPKETKGKVNGSRG